MKPLLVAAGLLVAGIAAASDTGLLPARVRDAIGDRIAAGQYPAVIVDVVDGDKSRVYGFGKLDSGAAPDAQTTFEIGSVTKTFTALLLAQQVQAGTLKLDAPVSALLPGLTIPIRNGKAITLENLATQHSALPRLPDNLAPSNPEDPYADYGSTQLQGFLASYSLPRDPGSLYEYSNLGVGLLGYALAQRANTPYEALVSRTIFGPLGMSHSRFTLDGDRRTPVAGGHNAAGRAVGNWHFGSLVAAGGMDSTGADMLRYLQANMGLLQSPLYPAMQLAQSPRAEGPEADERIGLTWMTRHIANKDIVWHDGMTGGYSSFIGFDPLARRGVVILANEQTSVDDLGFAILVPSASLAAAHRRIDLPSSALQAYIGDYSLASDFVVHVTLKGDQLIAQATGQSAFLIFANGPDEFFATAADISLSFIRDGDGKVSGMILHQNGDHMAPRVDSATRQGRSIDQAVTFAPRVLAEYVGRYPLASGASFDVTLFRGQLMVRLAEQSAYPIYASAKDRFFYKVVDAQIDFERDSTGTVAALILHQNGATLRAPKSPDGLSSPNGSAALP